VAALPMDGEEEDRERMSRTWARVGNRIGVWMYRHLNGRLSSGSKKVHVLMVTTPGRRTGIPRSTCVRYLETPAGLVVWGTGSGSRRDPDWFENLRKATVAQVQVRERHFEATVRELLADERDAMWRDNILTEAPEVMRYARKAGRTIPVAILEPI
jgi:deazaflavin-dependent oxidoreductase (nitroreductase family)